MTTLIILISTIIASIGIDQIIKGIVRANMSVGETVPVIEDVFHITYIRNEGAAFGMLADHRWVFMSLSTVAIIALGVYLFKFCKETLFTKIGFALIIGGGIGNMIDRISLGYVVDFIDFRLIDFAIFNGADSFVCVGAGLLILSLILEIADEARAEKAKKLSSPESEDDGE